MRVFLIVVATVALLAYVGACWFLYSRQRELIYYGWATKVDARDTDYALRRPDATLRGWVVHPEAGAPILYFGGNAEHVEHNRDDFARLFPGRSLYFLAYRGYGASDGAPSQDALVADAAAFFDDVQARHPGQPIDVVARSLGTGVASQLAARRPLARLALVTPFDSLLATSRAHYPLFPVRWLLKDSFDSATALQRFRGPLLIVHGGRDAVVPEANTQALIAALPRPPTVLRIPTADHDDIAGHPEFAPALAAFLR